MSVMLSDREWKGFLLSGNNGIFKNYHGKRLTKDNRKQGDVPLLTAGEYRQGVADFISNHTMEIFEDFISIDMFGNSFYHEYKCYGDDNIYFFINNNISKYAKLFIVNSINLQKNKYSYGKQFRQRNAESSKVLLPANSTNLDEPDYKFMEEYVKAIVEKKTTAYKQYATTILNGLEYKETFLSQSTRERERERERVWREFFLKELFPDIQRGKRLTKDNQQDGLKSYVSSTASNNGVDNFISNDSSVRTFSNCLSIANSGSVGASFYHSYEFVASDHITHLKCNDMNMFAYLFIATLTSRFSEKYNFSREINDKRISREKILLPMNEKSEPDYEFMEQYIKNLEYKKINLYLDFLERRNIIQTHQI